MEVKPAHRTPLSCKGPEPQHCTGRRGKVGEMGILPCLSRFPVRLAKRQVPFKIEPPKARTGGEKE